MNGIGLLITIGFCTIVWWGTRSYYRAIIRDVHKNYTKILGGY